MEWAAACPACRADDRGGGALIHPPRTLAARDTPDFAAILADDVIEVCQLGVRREGGRIVVRAGVFFAGVIAGCSCADDPTTIDRLPEYCELRLSIDPSDAATLIEFDPEISP